MVANHSRVHKGTYLGQCGVGLLWWKKLSTQTTSLPAFLDFKYEPRSFVSMQIGTNSKIPTTPFVVQHVTKLINPLGGGIGLETIPLHV